MQGNQGSQKKDIEIGSCPFSDSMKLPIGHDKYTDKTKCPFQQIQQQPEIKIIDGSVEKKKEKKEKQSKGGCPFMQSEKKRNPPLAHLEEQFDTYYISPLNYLLDTRGLWMIAFDSKEVKKGPIKDRRKIFDSYPIYLKSTLFHDDENTKKLRQCEVAQRFFVYDKFREKGNKLLQKQEYEEAIRYYERALGCFRYLEVIEPSEEESEEEQQITQDITNLTDKEKKELDEMKNSAKQYRKEQKEFKKQYKSLMTIYTDENVKYRGVEHIEDEADKEMCNSIMYGLYLNMSVCYMKMSHFDLARKILDDAGQIQKENSQYLFRYSQAILYDKWSNYKDMIKAKELIEKAISLSNVENIFKQGPGILKLMGLENAKEIYVEHAHKIMEALKKKKQWVIDLIEPLFQRAKEIDEIEQEMIEDGKVPYEEGVSDVIDPEDMIQQQSETQKQFLYRICMPQLIQEHQEYEIVKEMVNKYYRIIEFYAEQKKYDQVKIAKSELQRLLETVQTMSFFMNLDFIDYDNDEQIKELAQKYQINLNDKKYIRRLIRLCREQVTELFGQGKFNFEVFEYAMKDYFKKKKEKQEKEREEYLKQNPEPIKPKQQSSFLKKTLFSSEFWMQMFVLLLVMAGMYYFNNNTGLIGRLFSLKK
ncbi:unnamed protein product [Paramecium pentaurelia]|uniref:Tetratricopeptide repeat protein n=1 Tax=Paramecium pentaurelia TaxID=43138 RepID=A0A8S1U5Y8_9CILI|nr:unnamed protein product [Paramecium pentaurelia]